MPPPRLEDADERLDRAGHEPAALEASLDRVAAVNRRLGGTRAILRRLEPLMPGERPAEVLDVGTGSGELPRAVIEHARRRSRRVRVTALDRHPQTVGIARRRLAPYPEARVLRADALALPFADDRFDIVLLTLTLHHFDDDDAVRVLRELDRVSRGGGLIVDDLERCWPNYFGARWLAATLWRRDPITRHDGPVSVLRAFTPNELTTLARRAGLVRPRVDRHFFYRLMLTAGAGP
ncbi:MAG: methyltransferase domain-containing protein [Gemmatimonadota bacterium]